MKERKGKPSKTSLTRMGGIFLLLLSLFFLLAPFSRFYGVGYLLMLLFGMGSYLLVSSFLFAQGIALFAKEKRGNARLPLPFWLGTILLSLALSGLFGLIGPWGYEDPTSLPSFMEGFFEAGKTPFGLFVSPETRTGMLGFLFAVSLQQADLVFLTVLTVTLLFVFSLAIYFSPLIRKLFAYLSARKALSKAKKSAEEEEEPEETLPPFLQSEPNMPSMEEKKEVFVMPPLPPEEEEEPASPFVETEDSPRKEFGGFVRASSAPYRSTETMPLSRPEPPRYSPLGEGSGLPPAYMHDLPPRRSGLIPAYLSEEDSGEEIAAPSPTLPVEEVPSTPLPSPSEAEEPVSFAPEMEEIPLLDPVPSPLPIPEEVPETTFTPASTKEETPLPPPPASVSVPTPSSEAPHFTPTPEPLFRYTPFAGYGELAQQMAYALPGLDLTEPKSTTAEETEATLAEECNKTAGIIDSFFQEFGLDVHVVDYSIGPSVTLYEIKPGPGLPLSSITRIIPNLDRKLYGEFCRFSDRVIGTDNYAVEVPNSTRRTVPFREMMEQLSTKSPLMIPFGINIKNRLVQGDLRKFPHMLVCGATGSGKSIFMHSIICALLMRNSPDALRLILIDPKGTETTMYRKDPHLACPLISDVAQAGAALGRLVDEMEERNKIFQEAEVRDVESYNGYYCKEHGLPPMPYLVCILDEFTDLVETQKEKVTSPVLRLASKARSAGVHLIIATQRPDTKVISGSIKANFTTRVALKVQSVVDSMTILGQGGAETLLKYGDMLISSGEVSAQGFARAQGCLIEVSEIHRIVNDAASKRPQQFFDRFLNLEEEEETPDTPLAEETPPSMNVNRMTEESIYLRVREYVMARDSTSISQITQAFNVGYPRGSKLFRRLQQEGIIGPSQGNSAKGCPVLRHNLDETPAPKDRLTLPGDNE